MAQRCEKTAAIASSEKHPPCSTYESELFRTSLDEKHLITDSKLTIAANTFPVGSIQTGLQLEVNEVPFQLIGKGEQSNIQIKLAIQNRSHGNLNKLVHYIENKRDGKQLFLTTHSSYVLNKLSIDKICLIQTAYKRLKGLDSEVVKTLKRLPGYDTLRVALSRKVILVEGPSDELVLKKIYMRKFSRMPEQDGIDIIVVRGVGFNTFIEVGKEIGTQIRVLRDNDGDFDTHVVKERAKYVAYPNIRLISSANDKEFSLEPALIHANAKDVATLDAFAKVVLSTQTFKSYSAKATLES